MTASEVGIVVLIAFSAICPPHVANERSTFGQCNAPGATLADTYAVWMHFSGPLSCASVWTFLEAQYHNTLKTL